ncbi:hypothetical protein [Actinomadura sp. WMMB 499]|uniref:hypothetical protein n=1 Tax=Actinomadura sp. WMMB 499 TaxID=1219491 RepID=UPI00159E791E|nr:hypothetical protein [Actinomadura sp. WMMB 499]
MCGRALLVSARCGTRLAWGALRGRGRAGLRSAGVRLVRAAAGRALAGRCLG